MADYRIPLIVNDGANQIQELPTSDKLLLNTTNVLKLGGSGTDGLEIFHSSNGQSVIRHIVATGNDNLPSSNTTDLRLQISGNQFVLEKGGTSGGGKNFITANHHNYTGSFGEPNEVTLYYATEDDDDTNNRKLTTKNHGINIHGGAIIAGVTTVTNADNASSTTTGALQIAGGVGIGKNVYLGKKLFLTGTSASGDSDITLSGGSDAKSVITVNKRDASTNLSQLNIDCSNNAESGALNVAQFQVGTGLDGDGNTVSDKVEFIAKGEITADKQPECFLSIPKEFTTEQGDSETPGIGGHTNDRPIAFEFTHFNTGDLCTVHEATVLNNNNETIAAGNQVGFTSIQIPSDGTYLVSGSIGGTCKTENSEDRIEFSMARHPRTGNGGDFGTFPGLKTYPVFSFGEVINPGPNQNGEEFSASFSFPLRLNANDILSVQMSDIGQSQAIIKTGYFAVSKLY